VHQPTVRPHTHLRPTAAASIALALGAVLSGCGGGAGDNVTQTDNGFLVESGVAQKGPLTMGSSISINELNPTTLVPLGTSYNFEIRDDFGTFQPANTVFKQRLLESTATGYYLDELTGQVSTDTVTLRGLSDLSVDRAININLLTDLSNARIRALMTQATAPLGFAAARAQAQREVLAAFAIYNSTELLAGGAQPASFGELDLSKNRNADQVLTALSAVVTQIGTTGSGITRFLNQFEKDLADDGLINNSPKFTTPLAPQMSAAYKAVDFDRLALNLNTFYNTTLYTAAALSRWVDTSGGEDKVIDRFKSEATNVAAGTESKSPVYVAGSDDAGQCLSASAGNKLYQNGKLVTAATVKALKGEQYTIGLTGAGTQAEVVGHLQRSAPAAGVCPATLPATGLIPLTRHAMSIAGVTSANTILDVYENYLPADKNNSSVYALRGDGSIWYWNASTRGVPTFLFKDATVARFIPNSDGQVRVLLKSGVTGPLKLHYIAKSSKWTATVSKNTSTQVCDTAAPDISSVALKKDGKVWVKGVNTNGQLGDGTVFPVAVEKTIGTNYASIVCTGRYAGATTASGILALKKDGTLVAWGGNTTGVLGDGTTANVLAPKTIGTGFASVQSNGTSAIALKLDGSLWSWGSNATGILGNGTSTAALAPLKIGSEFRAFSMIGSDRVIATKTNGDLWAWGHDAAALIGSSGNLYSPMPLDPGFTSIQSDEVTASGAPNIAFGFKKDGSAWGWSATVSTPSVDGAAIPGTATLQLIGSGYQKLLGQGDHVFGIKTDGTLWAWGSNAWGQFGDGTTSDSLTPKQIVLP
jgi:alpha-tubulin suppressor-like RCC1 family protein